MKMPNVQSMAKMDEAVKMSELLLCPYFKALDSTEKILLQCALCSFANANYRSVRGNLSRKGK